MSFHHETRAEVIADSVSPGGVRLTTIEVTFHRFILAEVNTHRKLSRNSASSRAIPLEKMLMRAMEHPAYPIEWPREQPGMSGGAELEGEDLRDAKQLLENISQATLGMIQAYMAQHPDKSTRLHKSLLNRPLEWFMWHTAVLTSTEWGNLLAQRAHRDAQPEFRELAYKIRDALVTSDPEYLDWYQWHTPYLGINPGDDDLPLDEQLKVSVARCARTSYLTHDGRRDQADDLRLYDDTLAKKGHWSPLEHVAVAIPRDLKVLHLGNLDAPWYQMRHLVESDEGGFGSVQMLIERSAA